MKTLILGASGLVGGNCMKYFAEKGSEVLGTHFSFSTPATKFFNTLDPDDPNNTDINSFQPDVIIHCGALTWVDYCEDHPEESRLKTVVSTENALELAKKFNSRFVYLSTDYVFDGSKSLYTEIDTPNPLSVYGKHKLEAEQLVERSGLSHLICRITNVYGDEIRGKNFVARLISTAVSGKELELKAPIDQYATPVNASDVARAIYALLKSDKSGIYHLASTDFMNRWQLAHRVLQAFPSENITLKPVLTSQMNQPAKRPLYAGMSAQKFNSNFPEFCWQNLDDYLKSRLNEQ